VKIVLAGGIFEGILGRVQAGISPRRSKSFGHGILLFGWHESALHEHKGRGAFAAAVYTTFERATLKLW